MLSSKLGACSPFWSLRALASFAPQVFAPEVIAIPEMTYMDDVAVPIEAPHAGQIFDKLVDATDALLRVAKAFGLKANFAAGKTEAVIGLHGRDLAEARQHLTSLEVVQEEGGRAPVLPFPGGGRPPHRGCLQEPGQACCG